MGKTGRTLIIWSASVLLALVLILGFLYWGVKQVPALDEQFPANQAPLTITFHSPEPRSQWPADAFIPVRVTISHRYELDTLELWVDGRRISSAALNGGKVPYTAHVFRWMPVVNGTHRLFVRARDSQGNLGQSHILTVSAADPAGFGVVPADSEPSDGVSRVEILPEGVRQRVNDSNAPQTSSPPSSLSPVPELEAPGDVSLWLSRMFSVEDELPQPPELQASSADCDIDLTLTDEGGSELGFFIYRSQPGSGSFARIAASGPMTAGERFTYRDQDQKGPLIYYAASFNTRGESPGAPVLVNFADPDCQQISINQGMEWNAGALPIAETVDLAYVYYAFNGGGFKRFPEDPDQFLMPSEFTVSVDEIADQLVERSPVLVYEVDLVLWGWEAGSLVNLGTWYSRVERSDLTICNLGTGCTGDAASQFRSTYGEIGAGGEDRLREFYWSTNAPGTTEVLWQVASEPFPENHLLDPPGLIAAGCAKGGNSGSFRVDFGDLSAYDPHALPCGGLQFRDQEAPSFSLAGLPRIRTTYYARFTPLAGNQPAGPPSNVVQIRVKLAEEVIEPVIEDHLPDIYEVEILEFSEIKRADPEYWGCVSILGLDYDRIWQDFRDTFPPAIYDQQITDMASELFDQLLYAMENGLLICPTDYDAPEESVLEQWAGMLEEGLNEFWDSVTGAFNALKDGIVEAAAAVINGLGIPCDAVCKAGLKAGLEIGMTYFTGIPPTLPDFDQLADQGIDYAIELAVAEAGIPCPEACRDALRSELEEIVDNVVDQHDQPACGNANWAHALGKNTFCFPDGVDTEPVPEGLSNPALARVRVTRTGSGPPPPFSYHGSPSYVLDLQVWGTNTNLVGQTIPYSYSYWGGEPYKENFTISVNPGELQGLVFEAASIPLPAMDPGESITIPVTFQWTSYAIPDHLMKLESELEKRGIERSDVGGLGGRRGANFDWRCLYEGGKLEIKAEVSCLSVPPGLVGSSTPTEDATLVPCGAAAGPVFHQETHAPCYP